MTTTTSEAASALSKKRWANMSPKAKADHMEKMRLARKANPGDALNAWRKSATHEQLAANAEKAWATRKNKSA